VSGTGAQSSGSLRALLLLLLLGVQVPQASLVPPLLLLQM
jgi:hypothetical protein